MLQGETDGPCAHLRRRAWSEHGLRLLQVSDDPRQPQSHCMSCRPLTGCIRQVPDCPGLQAFAPTQMNSSAECEFIANRYKLRHIMVLLSFSSPCCLTILTAQVLKLIRHHLAHSTPEGNALRRIIRNIFDSKLSCHESAEVKATSCSAGLADLFDFSSSSACCTERRNSGPTRGFTAFPSSMSQKILTS